MVWLSFVTLSTAAQLRIHTRQHTDRKLARASSEAVSGEPIVKTIGDWPQQRHREKFVMNLREKRT